VFARRVAEIDPVWIEAAAHHLLKREFLEPDWDEAREEVVARERIGFLGLILSANRVVNYGPIAPEESRLIFAREALVYQRLQRRPAWLRANDEAILAAQRMEERLRTRDLLRTAEFFVEFYDKALPRQVSSAATLDYFTRHLSGPERAALSLQPDDIFARRPDPELLAQFPERVVLPVTGDSVSVAVDYRLAPGEEGDGATLKVPLLVLPMLTRASVDAAVPGLAEPRVEALLRSLPKEARRGLIPIAATAAAFMDTMGAPSTNLQRLAEWLKESRGIPEGLIRFDVDAVPAHLTAQLSVVEAAPEPRPFTELARGSDLGVLRRRCAAKARAELDRRARALCPGVWRRFELGELGDTAAIDVGQGSVHVHPALARRPAGVELRFEWSREEAARTSRQGATALARSMLERQARDLAKTIASDTQLLLAASPYLHGDALSDALLHLVFRRACFQDADPPVAREAFEAAVEAGRERLYPALSELTASARSWFTEARGIRRLLDDPRARSHAPLTEESHAHLRRLLSAERIVVISMEWLRQVPRYMKAEERRWQRLLARGSEPPGILRELNEWTARAKHLDSRVSAEMRWVPQLDELHAWIEEYRVSLYAQELKTLGPVSAARLTARAAEIDAWLTR
jgi:ATP-dependent helicase HrpA